MHGSLNIKYYVIDDYYYFAVNQRITEIEKSGECIILGLPPETESLYTFVNETVREIGVKLTDEEIIPNVRHCATSHLIMRVSFSLEFVLQKHRKYLPNKLL